MLMFVVGQSGPVDGDILEIDGRKDFSKLNKKLMVGIDGTEITKLVRPGAPGGVENTMIVELYLDSM